jgi:hypothetical protein
MPHGRGGYVETTPTRMVFAPEGGAPPFAAAATDSSRFM